MADLECPKCGKIYKRAGVYYENHVKGCQGKGKKKKKIQRVINPTSTEFSGKIEFRLELIENRLGKIEQEFKNFKLKQKKKPNIKSDRELLNIVSSKIQELSQKMMGIQKVLLKDLYEEISEEYHISKDNYSKSLIRLYNSNKIQLEPGMSNSDFSVRDNFGNIFKLIRIID